MAQKFGIDPASLVDPDREMGNFERYCLNEAIYIRGILEESKAYKHAMGEDDMVDAAIDTADGKNPLSGNIRGRVGVLDPEMEKRYLAAGGTLPKRLTDGKK